MPSLVEIREELNARRKEMHDVYAQAGQEMDFERVTALGTGDTAWKVLEFRRRDEEINKLAAQEQTLAMAEIIARKNEEELGRLSNPSGGFQHPGGVAGERKEFRPQDLRKHIEGHRAYKNYVAGGMRGAVTLDIPGVDFKTLITLSTINRQATRLDPVQMGLEERTVADLMLSSNIDGNTVEYYEETTVTNNADAISGPTTDTGTVEAPESALAWTLRTKYVSDIAHFIPATKDSMMDVSFLEGQIRGRLAYGVIRREEALLLHGDGVAPNLLGLLNAGIQTQAKGADPSPDAVYRAMQKVRGAAGSGFSEPTAIVMHPNDYTSYRLMRTSDGIYINGSPSEQGPDRMWGLPIRQTTEMTEHVALAGAFRPHAEVMRREGITITLSTEHSDYFTKRKVAILAEERIALAVYRPSAFCTATGLV